MSSSNQQAHQNVNENQARALVYKFLSSLYAKELNQEQVTQLTSEHGQNFLASLALEPSLTTHVAEINKQLTLINNQADILELAADYCSLFLMDSRNSASPYAGQYIESEYNQTSRKSKTPLFGEIHQQMLEALIDSDIQIHQDFPEPGDHIAVILAFVSHLSERTDASIQLAFIKTYLMTWFKYFKQSVKHNDQGEFYTALTDLTLSWLTIDIELLKGAAIH